MQVFRRLVELRDFQPASVDWYIYGRAAEAYALYDVALDAYRKVDRKEKTRRSTFKLAAAGIDRVRRAKARR